MATSTSDHIEDMRTKILKDAEDRAQKIISEAEKEAEETIEQVKDEMEKVEETENREMKERFEESKRRRTAEEKTEHLRLIRSYKTEIIDSVFDRTLQRLREYVETRQYKEKVKKLIIEAGISIGGGDLVVSLNDRDRELINQKFLKKTADKIQEKRNTETHLELSDEILNNLGGAIISKAKESASVDNTLEERMKRKKEQIRGDLENILFR